MDLSLILFLCTSPILTPIKQCHRTTHGSTKRVYHPVSFDVQLVKTLEAVMDKASEFCIQLHLWKDRADIKAMRNRRLVAIAEKLWNMPESSVERSRKLIGWRQMQLMILSGSS